MPIDLATEKLYSLGTLARDGLFPIPIAYCTLYRYVVDGRKNVSGAIVFLESVITPRGRATSVEACRRFIDDLNC